ncbi:Glutathione transport system permease protein GsiD [Micromonospora sp. MW-13]|uniref:ABC transporter permease n=1 Tax=unclassified Micromonospora TaxID=2617518 RepID=UPI000E4500BC|nr:MULTISPECIES: ABC transporter permease [unclassified Micromonospora]MCX4470115.1 ABC transporter permease [Micromonospora sp. NBC_01655]RGC70404.1 Glutathione transport system permease protein GsiD [Micromonospora sp. MW-13]
MSLSPVEGVALAEIESTGDGAAPKAKGFVGRSPGQLAWARLRRDRTAMVSAGMLAFFVLVALAVPLIQALYGVGPREQFQTRLDGFGMPLGYAGGISGEHWFGLEPGLGRDIFIRMVHGLRTSLFIAFAAAVITAAIGIVLGTLAGYLGGWLDAVINWITDLTLAMPFLIIALALTPTVALRFYGQREAVPAAFQIGVLIAVFALFGWTSTARLVRGQVIALREREFVEAARASGAGLGHMLFRQLLPNIWAPILVSFSLAVPSYITSEAALSFIGVGLTDETPSFGRMIYRSLDYLQTDPAYVFFPGITIFALVFAFNLFGDALRDALDPKSSR